MAGYDNFDTSGLHVDLGEMPLGGTWSGSGDTFNFTVEASHVDLVTSTMPVHDPPVAWYVDTVFGRNLDIPTIACPAMGQGIIGMVTVGERSAARYMEPEPIILDAMPGRRP